jgi:phytol kinase
MSILIAIGCVTALFVLTYAVQRAGDTFGLGAEVKRKAVHMATGCLAIALPWFLDRQGFLVFAVLALAALFALRLSDLRAYFGDAVHGVKRRSWGDVYLLVAVVVLFLTAPGDPALYILPIAILTFSDAAAALVGTRYGQMRFGAEDRLKSIEGTTVFFVLTFCLSLAILLYATAVPRENILWLSLFLAGFATMIEADSWRGLDNLFVPLGIHTMLVAWGNLTPAVLAMIAIIWVALIAASQVYSGKLGVSPHASRAGLIALFLTGATVSWAHAVLPVTALGAHLVARALASSEDKAAEQGPDFVEVLVLTGVFWLAVALLMGKPGTAFYSACFATIVCAEIMRAVAHRALHLRLAVTVAAIAGCIFLYASLMPWFNPQSLWPGETVLMAAVLAGMALSTAFSFMPQLMPRSRMSAVFQSALIALIVPAAVYTYGVFA